MPSLTHELEASLHKAIQIATQRRQEYATLEHLLLALLDDSEVASTLTALDVNLKRLRRKLVDYVDHSLTDLISPADFGSEEAKPTTAFQRVVQRAVLHVQNSGSDQVTGPNTLVALFTERESPAVIFMADEGLSRLDVVSYLTHGITKTPAKKVGAAQLEDAISKSAAHSPSFKVSRGRVRYSQSPAKRRLAEYKDAAEERCEDLVSLCALRSNEQPQLKKLADRYAAALSKLSRVEGAYRLLLVGEELRGLLMVKAKAPIDADRNPPMDADIVFAARALLTAHAGLMTLFPDAMATAAEIDRFQEQASSVAGLSENALNPVLEKLNRSKEIFDEKTQEITSEIATLSRAISIGEVLPTRTAIAAKRGWVQGALASIAHYVLKLGAGTDKAVRDAVVKESVAAAIKNKGALAAAIVRFLQTGKDALISLAHSSPTYFGWLESLIRWLGFA
jgi:hypothetical protein